MRVLTFTTLYPNSIQSSHGLFVEHRLRNLVAHKGVDAKVVAPVPWFPSRHRWFGAYSDFARVTATETRCGLEVLHPRYPVVPKIGMILSPWLLALASLPTVRSLRAQGFPFEIIDAHFLYPDGVAAMVLGSLTGVPVVMTARGTDVHTYIEMPMIRRLIVWSARRVHKVVTVSGALKDALTRIGVNPADIVTLRNGVDLDLFSPTPKVEARARVGFDRRTLLSVGQLRRVKGHELLIRAMPGIPDADLVVIGRGEERGSLSRLVRDLRLEPRVKFLDPRSQSELVDYYSAADALVLPSEREGWPNVVLEAMACDTPVVAADVWGMKEIVTSSKAGVLFAPRTADALTAAVARLFENYPRPGETRRFAEAFSWEETSTGLMELFRSAISPPDICSEGVA